MIGTATTEITLCHVRDETQTTVACRGQKKHEFAREYECVGTLLQANLTALLQQHSLYDDDEDDGDDESLLSVWFISWFVAAGGGRFSQTRQRFHSQHSHPHPV